MNEQDRIILQSVMMLVHAYPHTKTPPETVKLYVSMLRDVAPDMLKTAVMDIIATSESNFLPTIAMIRRKCSALVNESRGVVTPDEAWALVVGSFKRKPWPENCNVEDINKAVRMIGGYDVIGQCTDRDLPFLGNRYKACYKDVLERRQREVLQLPTVKEHVALMAGEVRLVSEEKQEQARRLMSGMFIRD